jgi:hypothetical protein
MVVVKKCGAGPDGLDVRARRAGPQCRAVPLIQMSKKLIASCAKMAAIISEYVQNDRKTSFDTNCAR